MIYTNSFNWQPSTLEDLQLCIVYYFSRNFLRHHDWKNKIVFTNFNILGHIIEFLASKDFNIYIATYKDFVTLQKCYIAKSKVITKEKTIQWSTLFTNKHHMYEFINSLLDNHK